MATGSLTQDPKTQTAGTARLNCRVDAHIKRRAEEAARLLGQSITDFAEAALAEKAEAVLARAERLTLSERDFAQFVEAINAPAGPTPALRRAADEYQHLRTRSPDENW